VSAKPSGFSSEILDFPLFFPESEGFPVSDRT
jgi:hypothetical protein